MVNPFGRIALVQAVDHTRVIDMEVKRVVGVGWVVRVAHLRFFPGNDFAQVLDQGFAFCKIPQSKDAFAVDARSAHRKSARGGRGGRF